MIIYSNHYRDQAGESQGFTFHSSEAEANRFRTKRNTWDYDTERAVLEFKPTKAGILRLLDRVAGHPDNG